MGLRCSKKQIEDEEEGGAAPIVRLSPFRPRRFPSRSRSFADAAAPGCGPHALLSLSLEALALSVHLQPSKGLATLPPDLSQLLLERLVATGRLNDAVVLKLRRTALHFFRLPLGAYPEPVRPFWMRCLSTPSLEVADLSKTEGIDDVLGSLGNTPHLTQLCLDYCVDLTDGGLALLRGRVSLQELSLAGCELLTAVGMQHLGGLTRMRRLNMQTCRQISLAPLADLCELERLDVGWCSAIGDSDAQVLRRFTRLTDLNLARTQISDTGLQHLHCLSELRVLNLAGVRASDEALAALLRALPHLQSLNLERCQLAGDASLAALGQNAHQLEELYLGYCTAVSDKGLHYLGSLPQLEVLSLENCPVGDRGLAVLSHLTRLRKLDISDTAAGNEIMGAVGAMRQLECLNLSFTSVNDVGLKGLRGLSSLRCLNLDSRLFTDAGMVSVAQLTGLECLDLFGARISDTGCALISKLKNLRRLELCGGGVADAGAAHLAALSRLHHLSLAQNYRVGNASVPHLIKLNELTALNLSQCRVTSNSVVALGCLTGLQTLALHETKVKPFAVDKLLAANPDLCVQGVAPASA